jgi:hypothetical protein
MRPKATHPVLGQDLISASRLSEKYHEDLLLNARLFDWRGLIFFLDVT